MLRLKHKVKVGKAEWKTFDGFCLFTRDAEKLRAAQWLAIVLFDGESDEWLVADEAGLEQLRLYYALDWADTGREFEVVLAQRPALVTKPMVVEGK